MHLKVFVLIVSCVAWIFSPLSIGELAAQQSNQVSADALPKGAIVQLGQLTPQKPGRDTPGPRWITLLQHGQVAATCGTDKKLIFWSVRTGKATRTVDGHLYVAISPNEKIIASRADYKANAIRLLDIVTLKEIGTIPDKRDIFHMRQDFYFSPNGTHVLVGGGTNYNRDTDPPLSMWEIASGKKTREFPLRQILGSVSIDANGKLLATSKWIGDAKSVQAQLWDLRSAKELCRFSNEPGCAVSSVCLSEDGALLALIGVDPYLRMWDVDKNEERWRIRTLGSGLCGAFSPDGRMIAVGASEKVHLIETATGQVRGYFEHARGRHVAVTSVCFSPDGLLLASAGRETAPMIWDVTGRILAAKPSKALTAKEVESYWTDLAASDGANAWQAILALKSRPEQAVASLKERLLPNTKVDARRLAQLQKDLNDDRFQVRERATKQLQVLGRSAVPFLRKMLASEPPVEVRKRATVMLEKIAKGDLGGEEIRALRAHEVMESIATSDVRKLLALVAEGEPTALVTQDAKAALSRLAKRLDPHKR